MRMQTRNDLQLPSLANSSLACEDRTKGGESAKRGRGLRNMSCANPGFAVQSCDPKFAQENPRMVRIRTLRITYTSENAHCVHTVVFSLALLPFMLSAMKLPSTHMVFNIQLLYMHLHCSQPVSISLTM